MSKSKLEILFLDGGSFGCYGYLHIPTQEGIRANHLIVVYKAHDTGLSYY